MTVYQRTPNWATPLHNRPITPQEQAELKANFPAMVETLAKSASGFLHVPSGKNTFDDSPEERQAFYQQVWETGGFGKIITNYSDMTLNPAANAEWSKFVAGKIRAAVNDPATAEKLSRPTTAMPESAPRTYRLLRGLQPVQRLAGRPERDADHRGHRNRHRDRGRAAGVRHHRLGHRLRLRHRRAQPARGPRPGRPAPRGVLVRGPLTYLGPMCHRFPNFFFPGGPHGAAGNNPRYSGDQSDFIAGLRSISPASTGTG